MKHYQVDQDILLDYIDNRLTPEHSAAIDRLLLGDPALRTQVQALRGLRHSLAVTFDAVEFVPAPTEAIWKRVKQQMGGSGWRRWLNRGRSFRLAVSFITLVALAVTVLFHALPSLKFSASKPPIVSPSGPATVMSNFGNLTLRLQTNSSVALAGEMIQATLALEVKGHERYVLMNLPHNINNIQVVNESTGLPVRVAHIVENHNHWSPCRPNGCDFSHKVISDQVISKTISVYVPTTLPAPHEQYSLWGHTYLYRTGDGTAHYLSVGPLPIQVQEPRPEQMLNVQLQTDRHSWRLKVTEPDGRPPQRPVWARIGIHWGHRGPDIREFDPSPDGTWSGDYSPGRRLQPVYVSAFVFGPGYTTRIVEEFVQDTDDPTRAWPHSLNHTVSSIEEAKELAKFPIAQPRGGFHALELETIEVELASYNKPHDHRIVQQEYRLPDGRYIRLRQSYGTDEHGQSVKDIITTRRIQIGQRAIHAYQEFGWWKLTWQSDDSAMHFELAARDLSLEQLSAIVAGIQ